MDRLMVVFGWLKKHGMVLLGMALIVLGLYVSWTGLASVDLASMLVTTGLLLAGLSWHISAQVLSAVRTAGADVRSGNKSGAIVALEPVAMDGLSALGTVAAKKTPEV